MQLHRLHGDKADLVTPCLCWNRVSMVKRCRGSTWDPEFSLQPLSFSSGILTGSQQLLIVKIVPLVAQIEGHCRYLEKHVVLVLGVTRADPILSRTETSAVCARDHPGTWTEGFRSTGENWSEQENFQGLTDHYSRYWLCVFMFGFEIWVSFVSVIL